MKINLKLKDSNGREVQEGDLIKVILPEINVEELYKEEPIFYAPERTVVGYFVFREPGKMVFDAGECRE
jgi:hypothetical protein